jgi:hypothetical protein
LDAFLNERHEPTTDVLVWRITGKCWRELNFSVKMRVFWDIASCSLAGVHQRFRGAYCVHHQGDDISHLTNGAVVQSCATNIGYYITSGK